MKSKRESHCHQKINVDLINAKLPTRLNRTIKIIYPWGHEEQTLVLRHGVKCIGHLDGDEDRQGHGHGLRGLEDLARDSLELLGGSVALHVVGQLPEGHLGSSGVNQEPVGGGSNSGGADIGSNDHVSKNVTCDKVMNVSFIRGRLKEFPTSLFININTLIHILACTSYRKGCMMFAKYLKNSQGVMRVSSVPLGIFSMMSRSGGLKERAVAGRPSVTRLTQSSWTGIIASGRPSAAARKMQTTSPMLEEIR